MWIYTSHSMISVTRHLSDPDLMHIRGRIKGDIEAIFPEADVQETPDTDYRFRTNLPAILVADRVRDLILGIEYSNFKATVKEHDRHDAYFEAYEGMVKFQVNRKLENR